MKTIAQVLKKAKLNDILTNGKQYWKVIDTNYDSYIVIASPVTKTGKRSKSGFELWSSGIENVAVIPNLRILK
jgi:hypothetical protein